MSRLRWLLAAAAAAALAAAPAAPAPASSSGGPTAVAAKTCSAGFVHGVIGGAEKCLRRGEFCATRYASQYRRYGFRCTGGRLR
jgi:hypothetical protein